MDAGARPRPSSIYLAGWAIVCLHTCAATTAVAETYAVRLHWQSSTDPDVAGYSAYIRPLDGSYGPPQDLGLPAPETDATLSFVVGGLDAATGYAFALTAYLADGTESGLSNELEAPARSAPRSCAGDADCIDGAAGDPCQASFCLAGTCALPATCMDGQKNGSESDVDCGGGSCPKCAQGGASLQTHQNTQAWDVGSAPGRREY